MARTFWKMSGSGNDFVFFDARHEASAALETAAAIGALCERRTGIGADGVVFIERDPEHAFGIRYFNRDGTLAELCGNASLCSVTLAVELGIVSGGRDFTFRTSSGPLTGRLAGGLPEIDAAQVTEYQPAFSTALHAGERRVGYARVGVPHLVVLVDDVERVDVGGRGRELRHLPELHHGANANFVSAAGDGWRMRTYERGVEEETLACGTGAVATSAMLTDWGLAAGPVRIATSSGRDLVVEFRGDPGVGHSTPSLRGEGRLVFKGELGDIAGLKP